MGNRKSQKQIEAHPEKGVRYAHAESVDDDPLPSERWSLPQCARAVGLCIGAHCGKRVLYAAFSFSEPLNELNNGL